MRDTELLAKKEYFEILLRIERALGSEQIQEQLEQIDEHIRYVCIG